MDNRLRPPNLRRHRAQALTAHVMQIINRYICDHDPEHDFHSRASRDLYEAFCNAGVEVITDHERAMAGLAPRDEQGLTLQELQAIEYKRLEAMLRPIGGFIFPPSGSP